MPCQSAVDERGSVEAWKEEKKFSFVLLPIVARYDILDQWLGFASS